MNTDAVSLFVRLGAKERQYLLLFWTANAFLFLKTFVFICVYLWLIHSPRRAWLLVPRSQAPPVGAKPSGQALTTTLVSALLAS